MHMQQEVVLRKSIDHMTNCPLIVSDELLNNEYSVSNMLSKKHNSAVYHWPVKEVIYDRLLAFFSASIKAVTHY